MHFTGVGVEIGEKGLFCKGFVWIFMKEKFQREERYGYGRKTTADDLRPL
jgi:hypothetical protein